jgi:hypothetical protein
MREMTKLPGLLLLTLLLAGGTFVLAQGGAPNPEAIMKAVDTRDDGDDLEWEIEMTLVDRRGQKRVRDSHLFRKHYQVDGRRQDRQVTVFTAPANIRNVGLLSFDNKDAGTPDDLWLYLPALKKLRRIPASERGDNFVGTDFTYEDVKGGFAYNDYAYKYLGQREWEDGGAKLKVHAVEARPKSPELQAALGFARTEILVRPDVHLRVHQKFFDASGNLDRELIARDIRQVDGIWTFHVLEAQNHETGHKTVMVLKKVKHNQGLADTLFHERTLLSEKLR